MLAELGLVGFGFYLAFWIVLLLSAAALWWFDRSNRVWHAAVLSFLFGLAVVSFFGEVLVPRTPGWISPTVLWWCVIGGLLTNIEDSRLWKMALSRLPIDV